MKKIKENIIVKFLSRVLVYLLGVFIFSLVPVVLFVFLTSRTSALGGIRSYVVQTGSMRPALEVGSMVFTSPQTSYKVGQIITFNRGKITITHRIHGIKGDKFIVKGDANNTVDPELVSRGSIIGRDMVVVPYIGRVSAFIKTPFGFFLLLGIPTLLFIIYEAFQIKKEWEKAIERKVYAKINSVQ